MKIIGELKSTDLDKKFVGVTVQIELSTEDLAKQLSEQGYYFRCFECDSTQLLFEKKNKPTEPEKCECGAVATEHCSIHGINGTLQTGKPPRRIEELEVFTDSHDIDCFPNHEVLMNKLNELIRAWNER